MSKKRVFELQRLLWLLSLVFPQNIYSQINQQPNFIIIYTDDHRSDAIGSYKNSQVITPNLAKFTQRGMVFHQAHVAFSLCSPSRAAMLTGRYGSANGVLHLGSGLNENERTLAQELKRADYQTAITGKWHLKQHPKDLGFDFHVFFKSNGTYYGRKIEDQGSMVQPNQHCDDYSVDRAIDFLDEANSKDSPFFLWHCTQLPHMNGKLIWDAKQETKDLYDVSNIPVATNRLDDLSDKPTYLKTVRNRTKSKDYGYPDSKAIQEHTRDYYAVITEMDKMLGKLFNKLNELDLWKNTYVLFMGDNGWMLGEHGFTSKVLPYQPSTQVPLMIAGPTIKSGETSALAMNIDLMPTVLELASLPLSPKIHGKSLVDILHEQKQYVRRHIVYEGFGNYGGAKPNLTVINDNYRFIITYEDETLEKILFKELYDQKRDPLEMNNLTSQTIYRKVMRKMGRLIRKHIKLLD